ncbi:hypothetical protein CENTIMANUS_00279 [Klebsiella phage vB_KpM_Centimanus]
MQDNIRSDVPNENGAVIPERTDFLGKLVQQVENRFWIIIDNGTQLEIMGDVITIAVPVASLNVVTNEVFTLSNGDGLVRFQTNDGRNVNNCSITYNSTARAELALASLMDFMRNKNTYIAEEAVQRQRLQDAKQEKRKTYADPNRYTTSDEYTTAANYSDYASATDKTPVDEGAYWAEVMRKSRPSLLTRFLNLFRK